MMAELDLTNENAEVCVVGRCNFHTSIGLLTYAFAESWSRSFPTCIIPTDLPPETQEIVLPNGRIVPTWSGQPIKTSIFVDVFWNGQADFNYFKVPDSGLRLACIVWDSDQFPDEWINILNSRFDAAVTTSPHLNDVLVRSGARVPIVTMPPPLDLEPLLRQPYRPAGKIIRFGSVAAYHPRKGTPILIDAFARAFGDREDVELLIHSNLRFPAALEAAHRTIDQSGAKNIILSTAPLDIEAKNSLIESIDIFVNLSRGEGYSIGPREALALGKQCVLSEVGGHLSLFGTPGIIPVPTSRNAPARYPEIDNRIFGEQRVVAVEDAVRAMKQALEAVQSGEADATQHLRRTRAADFSFSRLARPVADLVQDSSGFRKGRLRPPEVELTPKYLDLAARRLADAGGLQSCAHRVVQMHDGGFYSIFNSFFSHLVWDLKEDRCQRTLPDWDVKRFLKRMGARPTESFCYGQPADGNIWLKLFEPLYGFSHDEMNDEDFLYERAAIHDARHNELREPLLTYVHAYDLYQRPWFPAFREQYHRVYRDHIQLEPGLKRDVEEFAQERMHGQVVLGAHVRHPSHTVEQPNAVIAHADQYIDRLKSIASERGLRAGQWAPFLATDQERVVERFRHEFGNRLILWDQARRTTAEEDKRYDDEPDDSKNRDGFQLQHILSANRRNWSVEMAREVVRDAHLMAHCDTLLHVVSNVSTAVSFINPRCRLVFCG